MLRGWGREGGQSQAGRVYVEAPLLGPLWAWGGLQACVSHILETACQTANEGLAGAFSGFGALGPHNQLALVACCSLERYTVESHVSPELGVGATPQCFVECRQSSVEQVHILWVMRDWPCFEPPQKKHRGQRLWEAGVAGSCCSLRWALRCTGSWELDHPVLIKYSLERRGMQEL